MLQLLVFAALVQGFAKRPPVAPCTELVPGKAISVTNASNRPACVVVNITGEGAQLIVDYPEDVAFEVSGGGRDLLVDSFEFGRETVTLVGAGQYRIEILPAGETPKNARLTVPMSLNVLPLQIAAAWQEAESAASQSKRSKQAEDYSVSLQLWQAMGESSAVARTLLMLGNAVAGKGDLTGAREKYEKALEICRASRDLRCAAEAANNSGVKAQQLGDFSESFARLQEAASDWKQIGLPVQEGQTLSNLGILFSRVGDFERAISSYDRARALLRNRNPLAYGRVLSNLGLCYDSLAQHDKAQIYFQRAITAETGMKGAENDLILARMNYGRSLMLEGKLRQAHAVIEKTVADAQSFKNRNTCAYTLNNLGQVLWRLRLFAAAERRMKSAMEIHQALGDKRGEAVALHYLGLIARERGNLDEARGLIGRALQIRRDYGMRDDAADSLFELAELELAAGNTVRAESLAKDAIPLLEAVRSHVPGAALRASFYARRRNLLDLLVTVAMRSDGTGNSNDPGEKAAIAGLLAAELGRGRALLDLLAERRLSAPHPAELALRQAGIRRQIDLLSRRVTAELKDQESVKHEIQSLLAEDEEVEARIKESMESHEPGTHLLTSITDLQEAVLSPQRAILEYHLGEQVSHVWLIRDREIHVFDLPPRATIERQVAAAVTLFSQILDRRRDPAKQAAYENAMYRLSAALLGPFKHTRLPQGIVLVLDGDLNRVPFAALQLSGHEYLGFHHDLVGAPSAAFLLQGHGPRRAAEFPKAILALYDPIFSADDPRIPSALRNRKDIATSHLARLPFDEEMKTIADFVPGSRRDFMRGADANIRTLQKLPLEEYGILHFSTHAIINDEIPELSRIALSVIDRRSQAVGGFLFPSQLAELQMRGSVVVLSACETALGKKVMGEGMMGFTSSLFSAGASQLVLTIAEVDAQASSFFLSNTYRYVLGRNQTSMEHALTLARQSFLKSDRWSDPYYWASYVVVGMPTVPKQSHSGELKQNF